jgi:uncharacterized protein YjbI with pentapeptide repeats
VVPPGPQAPFFVFSEDVHDRRFSVDPDVHVLIEGATFERVDFSKIRFDYFHARESVFLDCDFSSISSRAGGVLGDFPEARFVGCTFDRADLRHLSPGWGRFERCQFTNAKIRDWTTDDASFVDCVFSGRIERSIFYGQRNWLHPGETVLPPPNDFRGNDFSQADLVDTDFREGIDLSQQRLPTGDDYLLLDRWPERVERVRNVIASWEPESVRRHAAKLLEIYWNDDEKQLWQLIRRDELGRYTPREVVDLLHDELARPLPGPATERRSRRMQ